MLPIGASFTRRLRLWPPCPLAYGPGMLMVLKKVAESRLGRFIGVCGITSVVPVWDV